MGKSNATPNRPAKVTNETRVRVNPVTGARETVAGRKAGRKRKMLSAGDPLRTHDGPAYHAAQARKVKKK